MWNSRGPIRRVYICHSWITNELKSRESKLAVYKHMYMKCSMDACTTSPVEGWNYVIKHVFKCNSRVKIENSFRKICVGMNDRIKRRHNKAKREMTTQNMASRAPTAAYVNDQGQGLADRNFDYSMEFKSAQIGPQSFIAWNFDLVGIGDYQENDDFTPLRMGTYLCFPCTLLHS